MTEQSEWQFIIDYVKDSTTDFCNATCRSQLMALWTAYCMHNDLCVDTKMYDATLFDLWLAVSLERRRALRIFRFSELQEACRMGMVALKMQIPEVPLAPGAIFDFTCPHCGSRDYLKNEDGNRNKFCGQCGKALDWGCAVEGGEA